MYVGRENSKDDYKREIKRTLNTIIRDFISTEEPRRDFGKVLTFSLYEDFEFLKKPFFEGDAKYHMIPSDILLSLGFIPMIHHKFSEEIDTYYLIKGGLK